MRLRVALVIVMVLVGVVALPVRAQDGLTDEQVMLLERVFEARDKLDTYASYTHNRMGSETQDISVTLGDLSQSFITTHEWEGTAQVIQMVDGGRNIALAVTGTASNQEAGPNGAVMLEFTIMAEARLVDGTLYVNAAYETPDPALPELPVGWVMVEDLDEYEAFDSLQLDDLLDVEDDELFDDPELVKATATDVQVEVVTMDDGTAADKITVTFSRDGLLAAYTNQDDIDQAALDLFNAANETSNAVLEITLDADNNPLQATMSMALHAVEVDANALNPEIYPVGMVLSFDLTATETETYSNFDATFDPAVVPEELAE